MKKIVSVVLAMAMILCMNCSAFATNMQTFTDKSSTLSLGNHDENISPTAVSGYGCGTGNSGEFIIYSPSSSWFAHMNFHVEGTGQNEVAIAVIDPNGRILSYFGGRNFFIMKQNTYRYYNFNNAPAGNYRVQFTASGGDTVTVEASLYDMHVR